MFFLFAITADVITPIIAPGSEETWPSPNSPSGFDEFQLTDITQSSVMAIPSEAPVRNNGAGRMTAHKLKMIAGTVK